MSATKLLNQWGLTGEVEATYGVAPAFSEADGILTLEPPRVEHEYAYDGTRNGRSPGTGGQLKRAGRSGRTGSLTVATEFLGPGVAYSASIFPSVHKLLRASGHAATLTTDTFTYTPSDTTYASLALKAFLAGQSQALRGVYGTLSIAADGPVVPAWSFELQGIADQPVDEALPAITYPNVDRNPGRSQNIGLTLDGWSTGIVRSWSFTQNRELTPRLDDNSAGHAGFSPGRMDPQMEIVVEAAPLSTFNPYERADEGDDFALSLTVGTEQYNRFTLSAPAAQILSIGEDEDGPTALWTLTLQLSASGFATTDMYTITAD